VKGATTGSITLNPFPDTGSELSQLFDELVELPVDLRKRRLVALNLPPHKEERLRAMLLFDATSHTPNAREVDNLSLSAGTLASALLDETLHENISADASALLRHDEVEAPGASLLGKSIGGFLILEIIGRGGSSIVFRAERAAGKGTQVVALKLLLSGLYTPDAQIRFRREQATGTGGCLLDGVGA